jgi:N6-L-threonylcarbamoyladenine synthase
MDRVKAGARFFRERLGSGPTALVVAGGVAANGAIRNALNKTASDIGTRLAVPPPVLCTDNGAMIAAFGAGFAAAGAKPSDLGVGPKPGLDVGVSLL